MIPQIISVAALGQGIGPDLPIGMTSWQDFTQTCQFA